VTKAQEAKIEEIREFTETRIGNHRVMKFETKELGDGVVWVWIKVGIPDEAPSATIKQMYVGKRGGIWTTKAGRVWRGLPDAWYRG
jgi:hypothetical protein